MSGPADVSGPSSKARGPISARALAGLQSRSDADLQILHSTSAAVLRTEILLRLKAAGDQCVETPQNRFQARLRFAAVANIGRDIERIATAAAIILKDPQT